MSASAENEEIRDREAFGKQIIALEAEIAGLKKTIAGMAAELKRTREMVNEGEESCNLALERAQAGMWVWDLQETWRTTPRINVLFGRSAADPPLRLDEFSDLIHPDDRARVSAAWHRTIQSGEPYEQEYRIRRPDGSTRWLTSKGKVILLPSGHRQFLGVTFDITDGKINEERLRKSREEARFRLSEIETYYARAPIGLCVLDRDLRFLRINDRLAEINGKPAADHIGRTVEEIIPGYAAEARDIARRIMRSGLAQRDIEFTGEIPSHPGFIGTWNENWYPIKDKTGRVTAIYVVVEDISNRKRAEQELDAGREALRKAEEKYRNIFLNATEGIFQTTPEGRFLSANPALARLLGYRDPEHLVMNVTDLAKQVLENDSVRAAYLRILHEEGVLTDFECMIRRADGTMIWGSLNARIVRDDTGRILHYEGTFQDITQRKLAREEIIAQRDLALRLAHAADLNDGLALILRTALDVSGMECGGIWLKNDRTEDLDMICSVNLSENFVAKAKRLAVGSPIWSLIMKGENLHLLPDRDQTPLSYEEGFKHRLIVPILRDGKVTGSLNLLTRHDRYMPQQGRMSLDFLSAESGSIIARMQTRKMLEIEVQTRREAEMALQEEQLNLQETNAALKVLLRHREQDRKELEEKLVSNVRHLVLPYVEKLKKNISSPSQSAMIGFVETNLKEVLSPFLDNMQRLNLTTRQVEIVNLIKEGKTTKEIAALLQVSKAAVDKHRFLIRKRLDLNKGKANLRSYLLSLKKSLP